MSTPAKKPVGSKWGSGRSRPGDTVAANKTRSEPDADEATHASAATFKYLQQIATTLDDMSGDMDLAQTSSLVDNVLEEVGPKVACYLDSESSRTLERIIQLTSDDQLTALTRYMVDLFPKISDHHNGSHVVQKVITLAHATAQRQLAQGDESGIISHISDMAKVLEGTLLNAMFDKYASHVIRALLALLSGADPAVQQQQARQKKGLSAVQPGPAHRGASAEAGAPVPEAFATRFYAIVESFLSTLADSPPEAIEQVCCDTYAAAVFQELLQAAQRLDRLAGPTSEASLVERLLTPLLGSGFSNISVVGGMLSGRVSSHVVECILTVLPESQYVPLYTAVFRGHLADMIRDQSANFVVSHLISVIPTLPTLELILIEVTPFAEELLPHRSGILVALSNSCVRLNGLFKEFNACLAKALNLRSMTDRKETIRRLVALPSSRSKEGISVPGCLILQNLFLFAENQVRYLSDAIVNYESSELLDWCRHPSGSRVMEAFFNGTSPDAAKKRMTRKLKGHFASLAENRFASHVVDKIWRISDIPTRESIASELAARREDLANTPSGRLVLRNCRIDEYLKGKDQWVAQAESVERKKALFSDLLAEPAPTSKSSDPLLEQLRQEDDSLMTELGFSDAGKLAADGPSAKSSDKKKSKKKSRTSASDSHDLLLDAEEAPGQEDSASKDIDALFQEAVPKGALRDTGSQVSTEYVAPTGQFQTGAANSQAMTDVLAAIEQTTGKRRKRTSSEETTDAAPSTEKKKKQRKFMMN
ncbi:hypothetical protein H696_03112 [Fonticula alba]|uniref:Pumilio domain-containing protein NOP9 n=1 Tax=Fonticula alba TaxID=691883 RepID=A0A058Z9H6_FONAL|nr:hypothetical protein H696_03112 [Fonticula alba]KCV70761.1 hypothetical protein H696_03112 [Fonticula alba]|eukprot:XP_009495277.1 hypothetical protein H696_03112 [Fonticula alba]